MDQRENRFYREPQPSVQQAEPVAWVHEDDPARVISAVQKAGALKDGGASASSVRPYSLAAVLAGAAPGGELRQKLHHFLNAAAGEGLQMDGVDADDLYIALFPAEYARAVASLDGDSAPHPSAQQADPNAGEVERMMDTDEQPAEEARGVDAHTHAKIVANCLMAAKQILGDHWNGACDDALTHADTLVALLAAPAAGAGPVAFRVLRKRHDGEWTTDGRGWCDGSPSADMKEDIAARADNWRIEYAYAAPQPSAEQAEQPAEYPCMACADCVEGSPHMCPYKRSTQVFVADEQPAEEARDIRIDAADLWPSAVPWMRISGGYLIVSRCRWIHPEATEDDAGSRDEARYDAIGRRDGDIVIPLPRGSVDAKDLDAILSYAEEARGVDVVTQLRAMKEDVRKGDTVFRCGWNAAIDAALALLAAPAAGTEMVGHIVGYAMKYRNAFEKLVEQLESGVNPYAEGAEQAATGAQRLTREDILRIGKEHFRYGVLTDDAAVDFARAILAQAAPSDSAEQAQPVSQDAKRLEWIVSVGWDGLRQAWERYGEVDCEDAITEIRAVIDAALAASKEA